MKQTSATFYTPLAMLLVTALLIANLTSYKLVTWSPLTFTAGTLIFPLSYILGDTLTEVYGYQQTRPIIWTALSCNLLLVLIFQLCIALPPSPDWPHQEAYALILGAVPRIVVASLCAFFAGEFTNAFILAKLKMRTQGKYLWLRLITSSALGLFIDSAVFIMIAFIGVIPLTTVLSAGLTEYLIKASSALLATPLLYFITRWLKHKEKIDYYDWHTNFNPLAGFLK